LIFFCDFSPPVVFILTSQRPANNTQGNQPPPRPKNEAPLCSIDHASSFPFFLLLVSCIQELKNSFPHAFEWRDSFLSDLLSEYHFHSLEPVYETKFSDKTFLELFTKDFTFRQVCCLLPCCCCCCCCCCCSVFCCNLRLTDSPCLPRQQDSTLNDPQPLSLSSVEWARKSNEYFPRVNHCFDLLLARVRKYPTLYFENPEAVDSHTANVHDPSMRRDFVCLFVFLSILFPSCSVSILFCFVFCFRRPTIS
jgi:hypothetical protein